MGLRHTSRSRLKWTVIAFVVLTLVVLGAVGLVVRMRRNTFTEEKGEDDDPVADDEGGDEKDEKDGKDGKDEKDDEENDNNNNNSNTGNGSTSKDKNNEKGGLSSGAKGGIAAGVIIFAILFAGAVFLVRRYFRSRGNYTVPGENVGRRQLRRLGKRSKAAKKRRAEKKERRELEAKEKEESKPIVASSGVDYSGVYEGIDNQFLKNKLKELNDTTAKFVDRGEVATTEEQAMLYTEGTGLLDMLSAKIITAVKERGEHVEDTGEVFARVMDKHVPKLHAFMQRYYEESGKLSNTEEAEY